MGFTDEQILRVLMAARERVSAVAWLVVHDAHVAEDIFQNVALKAITKDVSFEHEGALISWASITARREGIDWLRKHKREQVGLAPEVLSLVAQELQPRNTDEAKARSQALRECIERAPAKDRNLLTLRYFERHSCGQVAERLGVTSTVVYKRLSRLHRALRYCINKRIGAAAGHPA